MAMKKWTCFLVLIGFGLPNSNGGIQAEASVSIDNICKSTVDMSGVWKIREVDLITGFIGGGTEYRLKITKSGNSVSFERLDNIKVNGIPKYTEYYDTEFNERNLKVEGNHPEDGSLEMSMTFNSELTEASGTISYSFAPPARKLIAKRSETGLTERHETRMECLEREIVQRVNSEGEWKSQLSKLLRINKNAQGKVKKLRREKETLGKEKEELALQVTRLTSRLNQADNEKHELESKSGEIEILNSRISKLKYSRDAARKSVATEQTRNTRLRKEIDTLKKANAGFSAEFAKASESSGVHQDELDKREEQIDSLQRNLQISAAKNKELGKKVRKVISNKEELNRKLLSANQRIFALEEENEKLKLEKGNGGVKLINE
jgi:hypothetical protein